MGGREVRERIWEVKMPFNITERHRLSFNKGENTRSNGYKNWS